MSDELEETFHTCRKAAEQGNAAAQYSLGLKYFYGEGVPPNDIQAHLRWNLAANAGDGWDKELKDNAYDLRWCLEQDMTPDQITEAQRLASEWKMKQGKP
ncbi:MAG: hypothetical protein ACREJN_17810 [Nitrospiraceae bacterium]